MSEKYTLYLHICPNGKRYVGITCIKPEHRWNNGKGYKGQFFYNAVQKYGWNNISHTILFRDLSRKTAEETERFLIALWNTNDRRFGYNRDSGGSLEKKATIETRRKMSEAHKGEKHHMYGKHHPPETRQLIAAAHNGVKLSAEHRLKISLGGKGRLFSEEHRKKIGNARSRAVVNLDTGEVFSSLTAAAQKKQGKPKHSLRLPSWRSEHLLRLPLGLLQRR